MRVIVCDRCGKRMNLDDVRKSITICRKSDDKVLMTHCDRIALVGRGEIKTNVEIDLCDTCKESFAIWFGKVGIYELG